MGAVYHASADHHIAPGVQAQRLVLVREGVPLRIAVRSARDIAHLLLPHVQHLHVEAFFCLPLSSRHHPLGLHQVSLGSPSSAPAHPREVFLPALLSGATSLVVAHNHPSGDPTPSAEDRLVTDRLQQVGELLGIEMLDHIVIGAGRVFSFAAEEVLAIEQYPTAPSLRLVPQ